MIIKSLSRKTQSHHQLVRYIFHDKDGVTDERQFTILHGLRTDLDEEDRDRSLLDIAGEFVRNQAFARQRKNSVTMYHEVLSFDPKVAHRVDREALEAITQQYIDNRAENALVLARPHFDTDSVHVHLMISPNEERSPKRVRMSIKEFEACKAATRDYQREHFPRLSPVKELKLQQGRRREAWQRADRRSQMTRQQRPLTELEMARDTLTRAVKSSANLQQIERFLSIHGIASYRRRELPTGILVGKRKYRYATLLKEKEITLYKKVIGIINREKARHGLKPRRNRDRSR